MTDVMSQMSYYVTDILVLKLPKCRAPRPHVKGEKEVLEH